MFSVDRLIKFIWENLQNFKKYTNNFSSQVSFLILKKLYENQSSKIDII